MPRLLFLAASILIFTNEATAQLLKGLVRTEAGQPISFASVGLPALKSGTVSDEAGRFTLDLTKAQPDHALLISCVGYETKTYAVADLRRQPTQTFTLVERAVPLPEVRVSSRQPKDHRLGNRKGNATYSFTSNQLGTELGTPIRLNRPAYLKRIHLLLALNENDSLRVRINLYRLTKNQPGENLLRRSLVTVLPRTTEEREVVVDVTPENLTLEEDFVLAVEVVQAYGRSGFGQIMFTAGLLNGPTFARSSSQGAWEKVEDSALRVGICLSVTASY